MNRDFPPSRSIPEKDRAWLEAMKAWDQHVVHVTVRRLNTEAWIGIALMVMAFVSGLLLGWAFL